MSEAEILASVRGAQDVVDWFGFWPSFHDSEVVSVELHRATTSYLRVHAFRGSSETDERGFYKLDKHAVVTFGLESISDLDLSGFNEQNVLSGLLFTSIDEGVKLILGDCYGIAGEITALEVTCSLLPGVPAGSGYKETAP